MVMILALGASGSGFESRVDLNILVPPYAPKAHEFSPSSSFDIWVVRWSNGYDTRIGSEYPQKARDSEFESRADMNIFVYVLSVTEICMMLNL